MTNSILNIKPSKSAFPMNQELKISIYKKRIINQRRWNKHLQDKN